jgi:hypothetical protein
MTITANGTGISTTGPSTAAGSNVFAVQAGIQTLDPAATAYYTDLDSRRDEIIALGLWNHADILFMDNFMHMAGLPGDPWNFVTASSDAPLTKNAIVAMTVMSNDFGAMVLNHQTNSFGGPTGGLVDSALIRGQACDPCGPIGCGSSQGYDLWFQGFNAGMNVWSRGRDGASYSAARNGGVAGISTSLGRNTVGGVVFGLSNPYFWDTLEKVDLTDFQFGAHVGRQLGNNWEAGAYIGGGTQSGKIRRVLHTAGGGQYLYNGDYDGNTFSASFTLAKVYRISKRSALRATVGLDTEHAWQFGFTERSNDIDGKEFNPNAALRQFDKNHYGRTLARFGLLGQTGRDNWGLNGRAFYVPQLGGKDYATSQMTLASGRSEGNTYNLDSLPLGRGMVTLGVGGHLFLDAKKTFHIYTDYSANMFKYATTQTIALGAQKAF